MPGTYNQTVIYRIQQANDIVDVVSEHVSLKKKGREMVGLCPFHDDHRPSMNVNAQKQIFKCFACGAGGDVFKFVQMRENLTFPQAVERLAERAGIKLERRKPARPQAGQAASPIDPNRLAKVNAWAAEHFTKNLHDETAGKSAREYLAQRQISPESIRRWRIGLTLDRPDGLVAAARAAKISTDELKQAGLVTAANQDKFINRLMFPIADVTGRVIGFGGRSLGQAGAKYINTPTTALFDKSNSLFGLEHARHQIVSTGTAVVVEGYTDVIIAHQLGCNNVVATLGTSFTTGHGRILRRYAKKVILVFDSDVAGIEAANRALEVCLSQRLDIHLASVPQGKDPCDFLLAAGKGAFEQLLDKAVDVLKFKWDRLNERFTADETLTGRKAALEEYLQAIAIGLAAGNISAMDAGLIVNRISTIIGLEAKQLNRELNLRIGRVQRAATYDLEDRKTPALDLGEGLFAAAQKELLEVILAEPRFFKAVKDRIQPADFDVPILKRVAEILFEIFQSTTDVPLGNVLANAESIELGNLITDLAEAGDRKGNPESRLNDALDIFERYKAGEPRTKPTKPDEEREFLRRLYEKSRRDNPHSVGMT